MTVLKYAVAALAILPSAALAQDGDENFEIVVTATGAETSDDRVGLAITKIDDETIERLSMSTVDQLLATTAGVTATQTGPIGGFSAVRIRGAEGEQTLALLDGVKINDPSAPGGGFDFANLLTGNIESIEILRGANSVPWGSQAIGGIVNITTRQPNEGVGAGGRIEYGANERFTAVGHANYGAGALRASLGGGYFSDEGISAAAGGSEADGYRQYAANGRVEYDLSPAATIDLRGYYADSRSELDGFPPPNYELTDTAEYSTARQLAGYAGLRLQTGNVAHRLSATINDIDRDSFDAPGSDTPAFFSRGKATRFEYRGDWEISPALRTLFGAEHERTKFDDGFLTANRTSAAGTSSWWPNPSQISLSPAVHAWTITRPMAAKRLSAPMQRGGQAHIQSCAPPMPKASRPPPCTSFSAFMVMQTCSPKKPEAMKSVWRIGCFIAGCASPSRVGNAAQ